LGLKEKRGGRGDVDTGDALGDRRGITAARVDLLILVVVEAGDEFSAE
jgi:hypothetical protein